MDPCKYLSFLVRVPSSVHVSLWTMRPLPQRNFVSYIVSRFGSGDAVSTYRYPLDRGEVIQGRPVGDDSCSEKKAIDVENHGHPGISKCIPGGEATS